MFPKLIIFGCLAAPTVSAASSFPSDPSVSPEDIDFTEYSLEQLMDIEVTVASRSGSVLSETPAAVYVLTGEEIQRAGHTSVPEALRMVPGFYVSRWTTHTWDVTSRGFGNGISLMNQAYLNQLLVMVDGVVVYSPQFAGVWWSTQDVLMEDVDRIEVVRGPGGALWGTNAVHGVVHIITKKTEDTQGVQVTTQMGTIDQHASVRYGGKMGESGHYRAWVNASKYETLANPAVQDNQDWQMGSFGGRLDWGYEGKEFSFSGRGWSGQYENRGWDPVTYDPLQVTDARKGVQLVGSISDPDARSRWQMWYSSDQQDMVTLADTRVDTMDLEYTRTNTLGETHELNWGAGFRHTSSYFGGDDPFWLTFNPERHELDTLRAFAMDTVPLGASDVKLTFGAAVENNSITGFEIQPTVRGTWTPHDDYMAWASISRAVRTPSLEETSDSYWGNQDFKSESLIAYELGGRASPAEWMSADLALYFNDYDDLHYLDQVDWIYTNDSDGRSYGAELALDFQPHEKWKLRSGYTYHHGKFRHKTGDMEQLPTGEYSPKHAFSVRSYYDLFEKWQFDTGLYGVQGMGADYEEAEYIRLDARLGWRPFEGLEAYVGVQGATEPQRSEYDENDQLRRNFYVGLRFTR